MMIDDNEMPQAHRSYYHESLTVEGLTRMAAVLNRYSGRTSVLTLSVLIDLAKHQGASPAAIAQNTTGERNNSSVQSAIKRLENWGFIELTSVQYKHGEHPRKQMWLTQKAAECFALTEPVWIAGLRKREADGLLLSGFDSREAVQQALAGDGLGYIPNIGNRSIELIRAWAK